MTLYQIDHAERVRSCDESVIAGVGPDAVFVLLCLLGSPLAAIRARALSLMLTAIRPRVIDRVTPWMRQMGLVGSSREEIVTQTLWELRDALASGECRARSMHDLFTFLERRAESFLDSYVAWRTTPPSYTPCRLPNLDPLVLLPTPYRHALLRAVGGRLPESAFDLLMRAQSPTSSPTVRRLALRNELLQARLTEARTAFAYAVLDEVERELAILINRNPLPWAA